MIQSSDRDILDEFDKLPYHIQYKITEFFKEFFSEVLLFDSTVHTINPSSLNSFYDINFDPNFLIKGNRHLRGNKLRGLDVAMYTQTRTQTVAEMRAVLDLFIYKLKEFVEQFNSKNLGVSIIYEPSGLSHNAKLSDDNKNLISFINISFVYESKILQMKDFTMSDIAQINVQINNIYSESKVSISQWNISENPNTINPISL